MEALAVLLQTGSTFVWHSLSTPPTVARSSLQIDASSEVPVPRRIALRFVDSSSSSVGSNPLAQLEWREVPRNQKTDNGEITNTFFPASASSWMPMACVKDVWAGKRTPALKTSLLNRCALVSAFMIDHMIMMIALIQRK
jgi:hypothetical protein